MNKDFLNKKLFPSFIISLLLFSAILPVLKVQAQGDIPTGSDPCKDLIGSLGSKAAGAGAVAGVLGLGGATGGDVSGIDAVPTNDSEAIKTLKENQALECETKKNTEAVRRKTVGTYILGIPCQFCSLDAVAKIAMKAVIKKLTDDTVKWINTGANGNPMFVTDPGQYFTDVANGLASDFIGGADSPLNFLCTPFAQNIKLSLRSNYATRQIYNPQCTFTGIAGFLKDGFNRGGWQDWFNVTQNAENNPYDSYLNAQVELDSRIQSALKIKQDQLNWGSGFFSTQTCTKTFQEAEDEYKGRDVTVLYPGINPDGCDGTKGSEVGPIKTPGSVVGSQLNKVLGLGADDLTLARSFDDVVSALVGFLTKKILNNGGLLGANSSDTGTKGVETGTGLTPGPQDFGPGTDPTSGVTCAPNKTGALFNDPVIWTAAVTEVEGITYSYEWINVTDLPSGSTDSALVMNYTKQGNKKASVKITSTRTSNVSEIPITRTSTIDCSPAVKVAEFSPLVINSCTATSAEALANEISPFEIDTTGERRIKMARVTWVANISGGSGVLAVNSPIIWSGESRDDFRHIIQTREFGKPTKQMDVPMWTPSYFWLGGNAGHYSYVGGSNGTTQTITKNSDGSTTISISRLYEILNAETTRDVSAKIEVRDANVFIENNGRASRDCKPAVFLYKP